MYENLLERINRGPLQQLIAFAILWFVVYSTIWTIIEPLNIDTNKFISIWRLIYIGSTLVISCVLFFSLFFRRQLQIFGIGEGDTDLSEVAICYGSAAVSVVKDGYHGSVCEFKAFHDQDYIDIELKASAHKAILLIITYKPTGLGIRI